MTTAQDLLSLGHDARMNTPSTVGPPNWCWRLLPGALTDEVAERLLELTAIYGRLAVGGEWLCASGSVLAKRTVLC